QVGADSPVSSRLILLAMAQWIIVWDLRDRAAKSRAGRRRRISRPKARSNTHLSGSGSNHLVRGRCTTSASTPGGRHGW
ncbi:hypothetical protein, partial [Streptomyces violaceoruber]|uniref:hypothetical protein n=1 Tax=Streptomyces violaceoruber TaxID=1935 RepID=UPI001F490C0E